jgi:phage terminase small subunit
MPLTPRQQRFVDEYLIDVNAQQAALRAGYSRRAKRYPAILMRSPAIRAAIDAAMTARAARTGVTRERILEEYARIAFADVRALADWGPGGVAIADAAALSDAAAAAVAMVGDNGTDAAPRLRLKTFDKTKALEALARLIGMDGGAVAAAEARDE